MKREKHLIIGITGNIGTGKSTVAAMLSELGADVVDADKIAHEVMRPSNEVYAQIVQAFGAKIVSEDGEISRPKLAAIVFSDPLALEQLEAIIHPAALATIQRRIADSQSYVVVVEAIKLIESGLVDHCDSIWVTMCPPDDQMYRLMKMRGLSHEDALQRVQAQMPQRTKLAKADVVIDTSGSLSWTREQAKGAWRQLVAQTDADQRDGLPAADLIIGGEEGER